MEEQPDGVLTQIKFGHREKLVIVALIALVIIAFLWYVREVLPPFVAGIVAAYVLNPIVNWLSIKAKLPRQLVVLAIAVVLFFGLGWLLYNISGVAVAEIRDLSSNWATILESAEKNAFGDAVPPTIFGNTISARTINEALSRYMGEFPRNAVVVVTRTVETLGKLLIFFITTFLLLLDARKLNKQVRNMIPPAYCEEIVAVGRDINRVLGAYIRGQLFLFVLMSTLTWAFLGPVLQLRYAVVISIATGILEWFPIIGPITAGAIAITVGMFQPNVFGWNPWVFAGVIAILYTVLRHMEDYLVIPNVIGRAVHLHPLIVLFALFSGGAVSGILGMFIAVPVAAAVKISGEYIYRKLIT